VTAPITSESREYDEVDLSSRAFWAATADDREKSFATLRDNGGVSWHRPLDNLLFQDPNDHGFWAITTHAGLIDATKRHEDFSSAQGILMESLPPELLEAGQSIIAMDPPRHDQLRRLISLAFTPKQMTRIEDRIRANGRRIVDDLAPKGSADFVAECAALMPMHNISDMMGIPAADRERVALEASMPTGVSDPDVVGDGDPITRLFEAAAYMHDLTKSLAKKRRDHPENDLLTSLVQARVDDVGLTDDEVGAFFVLLAIAGNDTTRQSTSHGLKALTDHPEQREWLMADFDGRIKGSVEEIVRWATPIMTFRRTAAHDFDFGGNQILAGEKIVLFYSSANRDAAAFEHPERFDLSRNPNPHVGFGGGGIHQCLGNQLARAQLRVIFDELLHRLPDITAGEPELLAGNFIHGIKRLPCTFTPVRSH
jgi:cytochrome P450